MRGVHKTKQLSATFCAIATQTPYSNPKHYADQESPIGEVIGSNHKGFREVQLGSAQAWYYPADKTILAFPILDYSEHWVRLHKGT